MDVYVVMDMYDDDDGSRLVGVAKTLSGAMKIADRYINRAGIRIWEKNSIWDTNSFRRYYREYVFTDLNAGLYEGDSDEKLAASYCMAIEIIPLKEE